MRAKILLCTSKNVHANSKFFKHVRTEMLILWSTDAECFYENNIVLNADKSYFLTLGLSEHFPDFSFNVTTIENATEEKILGIIIDNKLNFKFHLKNICKKADKKLSALSRILKLSALNLRGDTVSFISSQFSYCPLVWMFTSKGCKKNR